MLGREIGIAIVTRGEFGEGDRFCRGVACLLQQAVFASYLESFGLGSSSQHAPITAVLMEAVVAGDVTHGQVRLPSPVEGHTMNLKAFEPRRNFSQSHKESHVLEACLKRKPCVQRRPKRHHLFLWQAPR